MAPAAFEGMRRAGQVTADSLDALTHVVVPNVSTKTLNEFARAKIKAAGAIAANISYKGYEHATCISINNVVCYGIPGDRTLKAGDILKIDLTSIMHGWHGDASRMYLVGDVPLKARLTIRV